MLATTQTCGIIMSNNVTSDKIISTIKILRGYIPLIVLPQNKTTSKYARLYIYIALTVNILCWRPASIKIPLTRLGAWGLEKQVERTKTQVKIMKQKFWIVPVGTSSEYQNP